MNSLGIVHIKCHFSSNKLIEAVSVIPRTSLTFYCNQDLVSPWLSGTMQESNSVYS